MVARKERERARKRHAIERARREAGQEPKPKPEAGSDASGGSRRAAARSSATRPPTRSRTGRPASGRRPVLRKLQVGDVDRRGRVFDRNMLLHPRISFLLYLVAIVPAGASLFFPQNRLLRVVTGFALAFGVFVLADMQPTKRRALVYFTIAGVLVVWAITLTVATFTR